MQNDFWIELEREAKPARILIERLPQDQLAWRPDPKSRTLTELAWHMTSIPGVVSEMVQKPEQERSQVPWPPRPDSVSAMLDGFDGSIAAAKDNLSLLTDNALLNSFRVTNSGEELFVMPRHQFVRWAMLTHFVHHRAQLGLYLRMLNVPVPALVGPSLDENPWTAKH